MQFRSKLKEKFKKMDVEGREERESGKFQSEERVWSLATMIE